MDKTKQLGRRRKKYDKYREQQRQHRDNERKIWPERFKFNPDNVRKAKEE